MRHMLISKKIQASAGFTLIEVLVISPILIISLSTIVVLLINLSASNLISNAEISLTSDTKTALSVIEDDIALTSLFLTTKDAAYSDPYGPNGAGAAWSYKGVSATSRVLVARTYATSTSVKNPNKTPVYIDLYGCDINSLTLNPALRTNSIYFVKDNNLYRRTLTDESQTLCNAQFQKQSCPADSGMTNPICKAIDTLLLSYVTNFSISYYTNSTDTTPIDVYPSNSPTILDAAKTIDVNITASRTVAGEIISYTSSIKISKLNTQ